MEIWIFFVYIFSNPQLKVHHKLFFLYKVPKFDFFSLRLPNERGGGKGDRDVLHSLLGFSFSSASGHLKSLTCTKT